MCAGIRFGCLVERSEACDSTELLEEKHPDSQPANTDSLGPIIENVPLIQSLECAHNSPVSTIAIYCKGILILLKCYYIPQARVRNHIFCAIYTRMTVMN